LVAAQLAPLPLARAVSVQPAQFIIIIINFT